MLKKNIFLAAGGTGGHLFPALALAKELIHKGYQVTLISDPRGTALGVDVPQLKNITLPLPSGKKQYRSRWRMLRSLLKSFLQCVKLIYREKPKLIIGFGGYPSAPLVFAGMVLTQRILLHEQNAVLGRVNRFAVRSARALATSFPHTFCVPVKDQAKVRQTGNPVRQDIMALHQKAYIASQKQGKFRIFIMGGSQGARVFSVVLPEALRMLPKPIRERLLIVQQSRPELLQETRIFYKNLGIEAQVEVFFHNVAEQLGAAHLVISRAGASSCFEIMLAKRPVIFVPYPYAMDNHQLENAKQIVEAGGAIVYDEKKLTGDVLSSKIRDLIDHPEQLSAMSKSLEKIAIPDAVHRLQQLIEEYEEA